MHWDSPPLPFVRHLEAHCAEVRAEAVQLAAADHDPWPEAESYPQAWRVFVLLRTRPRAAVTGA